MSNPGSDLQKFANAGIQVKVDKDISMKVHHKFILVDNEYLLNGSLNLTAAAVNKNYENMTIENDGFLINEFNNEFIKLWNDDKTFQLVSSNGQIDPSLIEWGNKRRPSNRNSQKNINNNITYNNNGPISNQTWANPTNNNNNQNKGNDKGPNTNQDWANPMNESWPNL